MVKAIISGIAVVFLLVGCGPKPIYEDTYDFTDHSWGSGESPRFTFSSNDTSVFYNYVVTLRTTPEYEYSNLWVFMYTKNPDGKQRKDTLNFPLADPDGKWLGKKTGSIVEHEMLIGWQKKFPALGEYEIRFEQAVPDPELKHVLDLSLRVTKAENTNK